MPGELRGQPGFDLAAALRDPVLRGRLKEASENGISGGFAWLKASGYSQMRITSSADYPGLAGKYLSQLATERNLSGFDLVCDLISRAAYPVGITLAAADEEDVLHVGVLRFFCRARRGDVFAGCGRKRVTSPGNSARSDS